LHGVFLSDDKKEGNRLVLRLGHKMDAVLFGLLRILFFRKKVANCELVHCQDARECPLMRFCGSMSRYFAGYA
jgi:hypothetical protein